ncbi:guanylate-binding protein [Salix suchowensis]|nr:guanylate-binding protein [Salix suchowensis]
MLDSAKQESLEWRRKYEETWNKKKAVKDQVEVETVPGAHEEEARLAGAHGQAQDYFSKNAFAYFADALFKNLYNTFLKFKNRGQGNKVKIAKLEVAEQKITTLNLHLKQGVQEKMDKYELESSALKLQLKDLNDKYESVQAAVHALEMAELRYWYRTEFKWSRSIPLS